MDCFAIIFELLGLPLLFCEQNDLILFIAVAGVVILIIGIMLAYLKIENKYKSK